MADIRPTARLPAAALTRLGGLVRLDRVAVGALADAITASVRVRARGELLTEGVPIAGPRLIVSGWAARVRLLPDGRRQFLSFLLPGDLIGMCRQPGPIAVSNVIALTDLMVCIPPAVADAPVLADAYAVSAALEEAYLLSHITRLGRLTAQERIGDLLLELYERLELAGLAQGGGFDMPLTQDMLSDSLGLTSVHVNRMLQLMRAQGEIVWREGRVDLLDPAALARSVGRTPIRVSTKQA